MLAENRHAISNLACLENLFSFYPRWKHARKVALLFVVAFFFREELPNGNTRKTDTCVQQRQIFCKQILVWHVNDSTVSRHCQRNHRSTPTHPTTRNRNGRHLSGTYRTYTRQNARHAMTQWAASRLGLRSSPCGSDLCKRSHIHKIAVDMKYLQHSRCLVNVQMMRGKTSLSLLEHWKTRQDM